MRTMLPKFSTCTYTGRHKQPAGWKRTAVAAGTQCVKHQRIVHLSRGGRRHQCQPAIAARAVICESATAATRCRWSAESFGEERVYPLGVNANTSTHGPLDCTRTQAQTGLLIVLSKATCLLAYLPASLPCCLPTCYIHAPCGVPSLSSRRPRLERRRPSKWA